MSPAIDRGATATALEIRRGAGPPLPARAAMVREPASRRRVERRPRVPGAPLVGSQLAGNGSRHLNPENDGRAARTGPTSATPKSCNRRGRIGVGNPPGRRRHRPCKLIASPQVAGLTGSRAKAGTVAVSSGPLGLRRALPARMAARPGARLAARSLRQRLVAGVHACRGREQSAGPVARGPQGRPDRPRPRRPGVRRGRVRRR